MLNKNSYRTEDCNIILSTGQGCDYVNQSFWLYSFCVSPIDLTLLDISLGVKYFVITFIYFHAGFCG